MNSIKCRVFRVNLVKTTEIIIVSMQWNNQIIVFHYNCEFLLLFFFVFCFFSNMTVCATISTSVMKRRGEEDEECMFECDTCSSF